MIVCACAGFIGRPVAQVLQGYPRWMLESGIPSLLYPTVSTRWLSYYNLLNAPSLLTPVLI